MLNYEYPPLGGGGGVATQTLVHALARRGVKVTVVTSSPTAEHTEESPSPLISIVRLPVRHRTSAPVASLTSLFSYILQVKKWGRHLQHPNFDLIHSHFAVPTGIAGKYLSQKWNVPHLVTVHGFDIHDPTRRISGDTFPPVHWVVQRVLSSAQAVAAQSKDITSRTTQSYQLPHQVHLIPLGIPKVAIPTAARSEKLPNGFVLIGVGRLVKRKGFDLAIQALAHVPQDIHLVIIGDGPERENLERLAISLKVNERVHLLGSVFDEEKWKLLSHSDVYILPSLHEGFSLSTVEAMMMGLPVIASNVGGQTDYLEPQINALLVPPDPKNLSEAIQNLYENSELRSQMKVNNLKTAETLTDDHMAQQYHQLYEDLLR